ncbi:mannose-1-phosphate guanylyltransferase [bacterium 336/3]|nr:mannose-1-phosphate guanylyltransferase [bacterium 336/3]
MALEHNYVVIMAGGIGTRFWPFSRNNNPKQFHDILGTGKSLLQQTITRFDDICPLENIFIVGSQEHENLLTEQLPNFNENQFILEPARRNTAPCIAYAAYKIFAKDPKANLVIAPADHLILNEKEFKKIILKALKETAKKDILVTLGIKPNRPDTGYGYIQFSDEKHSLWSKILGSSTSLKKVKLFAEKPTLELAIEFLRSGDFLWNSGIFIWNAKTIISEFENQLPDIAEAFHEVQPHFFTEQEETAIKKAYSQCRSISIDFGIMEKAENVFVIPSDFGWSDLGTWKSLYELSQKDEAGNVIQGNVVAYETNNCIIRTPENRLVVLQGLDNYIVAEHDNVLMICPKDEEQRVKEFVALAEKKGKEFI